MSPHYDSDPRGALSIATHPTLPWACPDIWVGRPGGVTAVPGHNVVGVRFQYDESRVHRPFNAAAVEVYVFDPALAPPPGAFQRGGSAVHALPGAVVGTDEFQVGGTVAQLDLDVPPVGADPHGVVACESHLCLVARVFPNGTPAASEFEGGDVHEAQRNVFLVGATGERGGPTVAGVGAGGVGTPSGEPLAPADGWWTFLVNVWVVGSEARARTVLVELDLDVDAATVTDLVGGELARQGIDRVETLAGDRTGLAVGAWDPVLGGEEAPRLSMQVAPRRRVPVGVLANLSRKRTGTAYAVHARQLQLAEDGRTARPVGGATVLFHRVPRPGG